MAASQLLPSCSSPSPVSAKTRQLLSWSLAPSAAPIAPARAAFLPSLYFPAVCLSSGDLRNAHTQQRVHDKALRLEGILPSLSRCQCAQIKAIKQFLHSTYRADAGLSGPNGILAERELIEQQGALPVNLAESGEKFERLE